MTLCLSKSKYMLGLQCPLLLWYHFNEKDKIPPFDEATQATFDQGHEVGEWAKKLGMTTVHVAYGQSKTADADYTAHSISDLQKILRRL